MKEGEMKERDEGGGDEGGEEREETGCVWEMGVEGAMQ
jgi:hypothetical protein